MRDLIITITKAIDPVTITETMARMMLTDELMIAGLAITDLTARIEATDLIFLGVVAGEKRSRHRAEMAKP